MKTCDFLHGCTSRGAKFCSLLRVNSVCGILPPFNSPCSLCHTTLFGIISSPLSSRLTRYNSRHCSVLLRLISLASLGPLFFAIFFASSFSFFACSFLLSAAFFHVLLQLNSILKTLDQPPLSFVDITNQMSFPPRKDGVVELPC